METGIEKRRWIVAGFHAMNGDNQEKWEDVENYLNQLNEQYI